MAPRTMRSGRSSGAAAGARGVRRLDRDAARGFKEQRERMQWERQERMLKGMRERERGAEYTPLDALMELEEARQIALHSDPPQVNAAVAAVMGKAKIAGFIVDRQVAVQGTPQEFRSEAEERESIWQAVRDKYGVTGEEKFRKFVQDMRRQAEGTTTIDGEAKEVEE